MKRTYIPPSITIVYLQYHHQIMEISNVQATYQQEEQPEQPVPPEVIFSSFKKDGDNPNNAW